LTKHQPRLLFVLFKADLIAKFVCPALEHRASMAEVMGLNPVQACCFSGYSDFYQLLKLISLNWV